MNTETLDLNIGQCIKSVSNIGSTKYVNICNDQVVNVPWGSTDWLVAVTAVGLLVVLGCMIYKMSKDLW